MLSRLPVWTGSDAELPSGRPPLLMSFSQGVLLTEDRKQSVSVWRPSREESTLWMSLTSASAAMLGAVGRVQGRLVLLGVLLLVLLHQPLLLGPAQREDLLLLSLSVLLIHRCKHRSSSARSHHVLLLGLACKSRPCAVNTGTLGLLYKPDPNISSPLTLH